MGRGQRHRGCRRGRNTGLFSLGCEGSQGTELNPALCSALGMIFIQCLLSQAECDDAWRAGVCSHAGRRDPGGSEPPQTTRMTHRRVRAGFVGEPCLLSPLSLPVHVPWGSPCLAAGQRARLSHTAGGEVKVLLLIPK